MKKLLFHSTVLIASSLCILGGDSILESSTNKVVNIEVKREWRTITFKLDPDTQEVSVNAYYERVVREDGVVKQRDGIRETTLPWASATNIAPALIAVRAQFNAALPIILTNTP